LGKGSEMFGGYEKIIQIKELNMLLQSKMIEEWSRKNAMIKVSVLCFSRIYCWIKSY
jgi:hypothetical protein